MADTRKIVRVFLGSPGDLGDERRAAKSVIDEFNSLYADVFGFHVELVGWEETVSVYGRPQEVINRDLARCELFVGMIWKRWGTPPDKTGAFTSGFEEEFVTSIKKRRENGRPEVSLFFKKVDDESLRDPGEQLKRVMQFKASIIDSKEVLFEEFGDIREFQFKFHRRISRYIIELVQAEESRRETNASGGINSEIVVQGALVKSGLLSQEGAAFLRQLIDGTNDKISSVDVAHFRLLASLMRRDGNDESSLGVHDANLLFSCIGQLSLGSREKMGLLNCGFEHVSHQNVPLWRWLCPKGDVDHNAIPMLSLFGSEQKRIGVIKVMRMLAIPLPQADQRRALIDTWFSENASANVKKEALKFLAEFGAEDDLPAIRRELEKSDYQTAWPATDAIVGITLRNSREAAFRVLCDLQPMQVSPGLVSRLFDPAEAIGTAVLRLGIGHRCVDVRREVVRLLRKRGEVPLELASQLAQDSDAQIRLEAIIAMAESGVPVSDEQAKAILVKENRGLGALSLLGGDTQGGECFIEYRLTKYEVMPLGELELVAKKEPFHEFYARMVLAKRQFSKFSRQIRDAVDDRFSSHFASGLNDFESNWGASASVLIDQWTPLSEHVRKQLTRLALSLLSSAGDVQDLCRVRDLLSSGFVDGKAEDLEFLGRHGEWCDISLVSEVVQQARFGVGASLLGYTGEGLYEVGAKAILAIAKGRFADVLRMPLLPRLLSKILTQASDRILKDAREEVLCELLGAEDEELRKAAVMALIRVFPRGKLQEILKTYQARDYRYYNVVHWLDFAVSVPSDRARAALRRVHMIS